MSGAQSGEPPQRAARDSKGAAYQGAVEAVAAILITIGVGYWVDQEFDTAPVGLIVGAGVGFGAFVLRLVRMRALVELPPSDTGDSEEPAARDSRQD